jgi:hypothetical protein
MDWIREHFQIFLLIALGIGSLLKSMWEAKARQKQESEETYNPEDVFAPDEEYRDPMPSVPPPLMRPSVPPPLRKSGYDEAVAIETARALKHQQDLADRLRQIRETRATTTGGASATRARISASPSAVPVAQVPTSIRSRLRVPREVRRAFVMREILDPPVTLR